MTDLCDFTFSLQPRNGVFCFLISEARETTALEMPDHENTFVLKADNNMEYVIEAKDTDDMRSWLATIRYCMKSTPTSQLPPSSLDSTGANSSIVSQTSTNLPAATNNSSTVEPSQSAATTSTGATGTTLNNNVNNTNNSTTNSNNVNSTNSNTTTSASAPELPPRRPEERISSSSNFELTEGDIDHGHEIDSDLTAVMREYPW